MKNLAEQLNTMKVNFMDFGLYSQISQQLGQDLIYLTDADTCIEDEVAAFLKQRLLWELTAPLEEELL